MKYDLVIYDYDPKSPASEGGCVKILEFDRPWPDMDLNATGHIRACLDRGRAVRFQARDARQGWFYALVGGGPDGLKLQPKRHVGFRMLFRRRRFKEVRGQ